MNEIYTIIIELEPVAASRPRVTKSGHTYYPEKYRKFKEDIKIYLQDKELKYIEGAIKLEVEFYMPIPKSYSKKQKVDMEGSWHIKRPDTDNLMKAVKDGLEGKIYADDSRVAHEIGKKIYSRNPRIEVKYQHIKNPNYLKGSK